MAAPSPRASLSLALTTAITTVVSSGAEAHVKWFCVSVDVTQSPAPLPDVLSPLFLIAFGGFAMLAFGVYVADGLVGRSLPAMTRPIRPGAQDVVVRVAVVIYFLALWFNQVAAPWAAGDVILTPETAPRTTAWALVQLAVAITVISRRTCILAAAGIVALFARGVAGHGAFHMTDYVFFLGIAAHLAATSIGSPFALRTRAAVLVGSLAFSLMWTAIEKFLHPQWSIEVLAEHTDMAFGYDWPMVTTIAGFVEFSFGYFLATGRGLIRVAAVVISAIFISAIPEFGRVDLFGHVPIVAILIVAWLRGGSPLVEKVKLPGDGVISTAASLAALYGVALTVFLAAYYALHLSVGVF